MIAEQLIVEIRADANKATREVAGFSKETDNAAKSTRSMVASIAKAAAGFAAAAISTRVLISAVKESIELAGIQEQAERGLEAALASVGDTSEESADMIKSYAAELQAVTTFGDEATISAAALFTQVSGLSAELTRRSLPAIQDFASAMGMDLQQAASLVGRSIGSTTNALTRYGIQIDNSLQGSERMEAIIGQLNEKFGGFSEAVADTASGSLVQFQNALGDLQEVGGAAILEFIEPAVSGMQEFVEGVTAAIQRTRNFRDVIAGEAEADDIDAISDAIAVLTERIEEREEAIARAAGRGAAQDAARQLQELDRQRLASFEEQLKSARERAEVERFLARQADAGREARAEQLAIEEDFESLVQERIGLQQQVIMGEQEIARQLELGFITAEQAEQQRQELLRETYQSALEVAGGFDEVAERADAAFRDSSRFAPTEMGDQISIFIRQLLAEFQEGGEEAGATLYNAVNQGYANAMQGAGGPGAGFFGPIEEQATDSANTFKNTWQQAFERIEEEAQGGFYGSLQATAQKIETVWQNGLSSIAGSAMNAFSQINAASDRRAENEIANLDAQLEELKEKHESEIEFARQRGATEEELAQIRQQQLEEEQRAEEAAEEKRKRIKKQQFEREKQFNIAQVIMDTASAVVGFLANPGGLAGIALSTAAAGIGAVQLANIQSTPPPAFERGGSFVTNGPQNILVGDGQSPRERVTVEPLSGPYRGGGGGGITINISGAIGGREEVAIWVEEGIRRARKRGAIPA